MLPLRTKPAGPLLKLQFSLALILLLIPAALAQDTGRQSWAKPVSNSRVPNFFLIEDGLYRSAQPDRGAMLELERMGIKTVLNLRHFHDDSDETKGSSLKLLQVPIDTWKISDDDVVKALRIMADRKNRPLLIHCQHGADRTGTVTAMYRIVIQHWSKEDAIKELMEGGFGYHSMWTNIPKYIRAADIEQIRRKTLAAE